jgi:ectoine hydroxylase-related dioxygenase (phytanoyl-CoA dioxygenase family)
VIDPLVLYELAYFKNDYDYPSHGHDIDGKYYNKFQPNVQWANYWTTSLNDNIGLAAIRQAIDPIVAKLIDRPIFYQSSVSVLATGCKLVRPHVDTPHRHLPWNNDSRLLGIQVAAPLHNFAIDSGTTAFLSGSQNKYWDIKKCYRGDYTSEFLSKFTQPRLKYGDVVIWDTRVLHSQMPNNGLSSRYMLMLNYLNEDVVADVMAYEAMISS